MRPPSVGDVFVGPKERRDDMGPSNSNKYNGDPCGIPRKEGVTEGEKKVFVGGGGGEEGSTSRRGWAGSGPRSTPAVGIRLLRPVMESPHE